MGHGMTTKNPAARLGFLPVMPLRYGLVTWMAWLLCGTAATAIGLSPVGYGVDCDGCSAPVVGLSWNPETELPC